MSIIGEIAARRREQYEVQGVGAMATVTFRCRRVRSADLINAGAGSLMAALPRAEQGAGVDAAATAASPKALAALMEIARATVCAGVQAVRAEGDGAEWEPVQFVLRPAQARPDDEVFAVDTLPDDVIMHLSAAITEASSGRKEVAEALASFRAGGAGGAGSGGAALRGGPVDGASVEPGKARRRARRDGGGDGG